MKIKVSKILDATFARATFDLSKANIRHSYKDHLALEILRNDSSMAYNILALTLEDRQIKQIAANITQLITEHPIIEHQAADEFLAEYRSLLMERFTDANKLSTIHLLLDILADNTTVTAEVFALHGITAEFLTHKIEFINQETIWESKIQISSPDIETKRAIIIPLERSRQLTLERYATNLTELAKSGKIDPVIGREREIERTIQILSRRKKNNPILVGEAGVGKSAIVEGLALKIASGDVPPQMLGKRLFSLDLTALIAGTKYRGEFEERIQEIISELTAAKDIILFIDEIHTIVGAGATQGTLDTANILKPSLARSEIMLIGATTYDEYRAIEKDAALERRFQKLTIEPSNREQTLQILNRIAPYYESHHKVRYSADSIEACVDLSQRYIAERTFPDKAIDIMDEAGAMAQTQFKRAEAQQNSSSKIISRQDIEQIITSMTGIPAEQLSQSDTERLRGLGDRLRSEIIGQDKAVEQTVKALHRSRAGLRDEHRPIGVFLFIGPTGVGKTLLAKKIAEIMTANPGALIRIDMSEYALKHNLSRLIGSPPGYVGYGEGGQLTEAVRRRPYSVVLLDEIEKAHPDVFDLLLQLFDEGRLTDGTGRQVDFRNTVIIMTSNLGSHDHAQSARKIGYATTSDRELTKQQADYHRVLERFFKPEFLNRIDDVIHFRELRQQEIRQIVELELKRMLQRIKRAGYSVNITEEALQLFAREGYQPQYGARALRRLLTEKVENPIASIIIEGKLSAGGSVTIEELDGEIVHRVA